jgi:hypothetical protein
VINTSEAALRLSIEIPGTPSEARGAGLAAVQVAVWVLP